MKVLNCLNPPFVCFKRTRGKIGSERNGSIRLGHDLIEQINYIKQHSLQGVMFNISLVLISILRSTINDILSKFHSLTKVLSLLIYIVSSRIIQ